MTQGDDSRFLSLSQIGAVLRNFPQASLADALSVGQIESKKWLIRALEEIDASLGTIFVVGGWWGVLPAMMFESALRFDKIRSFDIDPSCAPIADTMNRPYVMQGWRFKASTADMRQMDYRGFHYTTLRADGSQAPISDSPDTIINTSCEHLDGFGSWWEGIPVGKLAVLQSNNFSAVAEHCNCVESLEQFSAQAKMQRTLFAGELKLPDYKRFMLIGYR